MGRTSVSTAESDNGTYFCGSEALCVFYVCRSSSCLDFRVIAPDNLHHALLPRIYVSLKKNCIFLQNIGTHLRRHKQESRNIDLLSQERLKSYARESVPPSRAVILYLS